MSDDDKFDELLRREAKGYRSTSSTPADAMWSRIEQDVIREVQIPRVARDDKVQIPRFARDDRGRRWAWIASGVGIAAALVIGVAIGRRSAVSPAATTTPPVASSVRAADSQRDAQVLAATLNHLVQAEAFLTEVRADLRTGRRDPERARRSRRLLSHTRLLIANNGGRTPAVDRLLEDLELVLAEIAALPDSGARRSVETRLLNERLRAGTVLPRIRTILPSPPAAGGL